MNILLSLPPFSLFFTRTEREKSFDLNNSSNRDEYEARYLRHEKQILNRRGSFSFRETRWNNNKAWKRGRYDYIPLRYNRFRKGRGGGIFSLQVFIESATKAFEYPCSTSWTFVKFTFLSEFRVFDQSPFNLFLPRNLSWQFSTLGLEGGIPFLPFLFAPIASRNLKGHRSVFQREYFLINEIYVYIYIFSYNPSDKKKGKGKGKNQRALKMQCQNHCCYSEKYKLIRYFAMEIK